jgi:signal transduction histidine kinase
MPLSLTRRIRSGYGIAFLLLLVSYFLIFFTSHKLAKETEWVFHSYRILNNLEIIKSEIISAETGVRGYIIAKDARFLEPYTTSLKKIMPLLNELKSLTSDNKYHQNKLNTLSPLITERLRFLSEGLARFQKSGYVITEEMIIAREPSKKAMDSIMLIVSEMKTSEMTLMQQRQNKLKGFFTGTEIITISSLVIALVTIFYSLITYNRENKAKEKADKNAILYRAELEDKVIELKTLNTELQELRNIEKFAATGRIARTIAHEVRNPLTNISLATEQLKEATTQNEETTVLLTMISRNANRINELVSDLLNATRFQQLDFEKIEINQLIEETLELANDRIELNHIKVEKQYAKDSCKVSADKEKMKVAILNIIVNAIEAMEKDNGMKKEGILRLKTFREDNKCVLEIMDNGVGMNEDTLQKIFEPYFTNKNKGNGLGLTAVQNTILNHKGTIKVSSKPGHGTAFTIILSPA